MPMQLKLRLDGPMGLIAFRGRTHHGQSLYPALVLHYLVSHQQRETQKNRNMSMDCLVLQYT